MFNDLTSLYQPSYSRSKDIPITCTYRGGPAHPLLIQPPADYEKSTLKVMYVGQETNGYEDEFGSLRKDEGTPHTVETLLKLYDDFTNKPGGFQYRGHFTNAVNSYQQAFSRMDSSASFTWNNIVKIGNAHAKGLPSETNLQWQDHWFDVIREEIRLLAPDVVLFFTGPRYDRFLKRVLPDLTFHKLGDWPERKLARVTAEGLPPRSFRTYHPNYLWRKGFYMYQEAVIRAVSQGAGN